ncbi:MAG: preprotein translocase subunit SecG [Candidatus Aerophobetes bacterium]|nr:preprotein translocase subunit SecG [Candidatus Aerophobetes bacterium]
MSLLLTIHIVVCIFLILAVLIQVGRGASTGATFGGGGGQTFFGPTGETTFLGKAIIVLAIIFVILTVLLSISYTGGKPPVVE